MEKVIHWIGDHWQIIAVVISLFIDWAPGIKWNPWKTLFAWLGKTQTQNVSTELVVIKKDLDDVKAELKLHEKEADENEMDRIRSEVLDFANSCRQKRRHTKEEYDHIFAQNDKYHYLLGRTGQQNGRFEEAFSYIKELYRHCMEQDDFLS